MILACLMCPVFVSGFLSELLDHNAGCELVVPESNVSSIITLGDESRLALVTRTGELAVWERQKNRLNRCHISGDQALGVGNRICYTPCGGYLVFPKQASVAFIPVTCEKSVDPIDVRGDKIAGLGVSPDGRTLAVLIKARPESNSSQGSQPSRIQVQQSELQLIDLDSRTVRKRLDWACSEGRFPDDGAGSVCRRTVFASSGKAFAAVMGRTIYCWDVAGSKTVFRKDLPELFARLVAAPSDGNYVISASDDNGAFASGGSTLYPTLLRFWDLASGAKLHEMEIEFGPVHALAVSSDGRLVAWANCFSRISVWDMCSGTRLRDFDSRSDRVDQLLFVDGNNRLLSATERGVIEWRLEPRHPRGSTEEAGQGELQILWDLLSDQDAAKGYRGISSLAGLGDKAVAFLKGRVRPVPPESVNSIKERIAQLDADDFEVREEASARLAYLGAPAYKYVRAAQNNNNSLEMSRRLDALADVLSQWVAKDPETLRVLRAIWVLERIGSGESKEVLKILSEGNPDSRPTEEAKAALERLANRKAN